MAMNFATLIQELVRDEGERLKPYTDTAGKVTIGVGRNLTDVGISQSESRTMLENDIGRACADLDRNLKGWRDWSDARQRAIANMAFNLGWPRLSQFTDMLTNLRAGHWDLAALDALDSAWARQVGDRAKRIAEMIKGG